jgi:hypothetical protein
VITAGGGMESCYFDADQQGGCFIVADIAGPRKRSAPTLVGYAGWAPWEDVLIHLQETAPLVDDKSDADEKRLLYARGNANFTIRRLEKQIQKDEGSFRTKIEREAIEAIAKLLQVLPPEEADTENSN